MRFRGSAWIPWRFHGIIMGMDQVRCKSCNSLTFPVVCAVCGAEVGMPPRASNKLPSLVATLGMVVFTMAEAAPEPAWWKMSGVGLVVAGLVWKFWPGPGKPATSLVSFLVARVRRASFAAPAPRTLPVDRGPTTEVHLPDWGYTVTCYENELQSRVPHRRPS